MINPRSRWDLFLYTFMVLVALDVEQHYVPPHLRSAKLFSHSYLLLYTEDPVVLKSESNNKPTEGCGNKEKILQGSIISPSYHTGDYHLSLYIHDLCLSYHELCSHRISFLAIITMDGGTSRQTIMSNRGSGSIKHE